MAHPGEQDGGFSYADYCSWPEDERWELIDGVAWNMSPAPNRSHQSILGKLFRIIADITDSGSCHTYVAPFDVRLPDQPVIAGAGKPTLGAGHPTPDHPAGEAADEAIRTVVQPDISVFCNLTVLDDAGAHGAPDLVVEILSPSTSYKDQTHKLALYERHGVREYWLVNGDARYVMVYRMGPDRQYRKPDYYRAGQEEEVILSDVLGGVGIAIASFL